MDVAVRSDGSLGLNAFPALIIDEQLHDLTIDRGVVQVAASDGAGASLVVHTLTMTGGLGPFGSSGPGLVKLGPGVLELTANNLYRPTTVAGGTLLVNGSLAANGHVAMQVGVLSGVGAVNTVGTLTGAALSLITPGVGGTSTGRLTAGGLALSTTITYPVDLQSATDFDQIDVRGNSGDGAVNLGNAALLLRPAFTPSDTARFTILRNDGVEAIAGTFSGLAEGATINVRGLAFTISYRGGDGNDIVLSGPRADGNPGPAPDPTPNPNPNPNPNPGPNPNPNPNPRSPTACRSSSSARCLGTRTASRSSAARTRPRFAWRTRTRGRPTA